MFLLEGDGGNGQILDFTKYISEMLKIVLPRCLLNDGQEVCVSFGLHTHSFRDFK